MSIRNAWKREMRVAFSRRAQPAAFRLVKWAIAIIVSVLLWRTPYFSLWLLGAIGVSLILHFIWRWKTKGWTKPWGGWNDLDGTDRD